MSLNVVTALVPSKESGLALLKRRKPSSSAAAAAGSAPKGPTVEKDKDKDIQDDQQFHSDNVSEGEETAVEETPHSPASPFNPDHCECFLYHMLTTLFHTVHY